jgi:hypothetical protein
MKKVQQETNLHVRLAETAAILASDRTGRFGFEHVGETTQSLRKKAFDYCRKNLPVGGDLKFGSDELAHYWYAQATYTLRGEAWGTYRTAMFDPLRSTQNKDGSWPAGNGTCAGPVYAAAVWCTILQLEGNKHPATRIQRVVK